MIRVAMPTGSSRGVLGSAVRAARAMTRSCVAVAAPALWLAFAALGGCEPAPPAARAPSSSPSPSASGPLGTAPLPLSAPAGSATTVAPTTPDAPFRAGPPPAAQAIVWAPPEIASWSLANGMRVLFVPRHDLPIVALRVVASVGAGDLPAERAGTAAFMGTMLEQGAGTRSALQLSDDYEALGADHAAFCDWDACAVRVKVLSSRLGAALDVLADVVLRPTFAQGEIERTRRRWLSGLQQEKSSPPSMEQNALAAALFGRAHPYGHSLRGGPSDIAEMKRADLERTWHAAFTPRTTTVVVAGDVSRGDLQALLDARFGAWRAPPSGPIVRVPGAGAAGGAGATGARPAGPAGVRVTLVDVPGAPQSQVLVAGEGPPFATDDRIALSVMNAILGGMFSSRINLDLREARAITYGARSRFAMRHRAGPFAAGGAIFTEHTGEAIHALFDHVARIRDADVTDQELADAKENAKLALPARFEGVDDVTGALQDLAVYALPTSEYATRAARIDRVTAEEVRRVARKWLHPESMRVVVTGDRARIEKELAPLGPVDVRDAYGDPVKD